MWLAFTTGAFNYFLFYFILFSADAKKAINKIKKDRRRNNETHERVNNEQ